MKHLSLFSGVAGIDLAAHWAGMETVQLVERDPYCQSILRKNFPGVDLHDDITTFDATRLRGRVDIVSAGFPCQPHSLSGSRLASRDDRDLWGEVVRVLGEAKPRWFLGENVPGLFSSESGNFFGRIVNDLAEMGYRVGWCCYGASDVGAVHRRKRVFIIAWNPDCQRCEELVDGNPEGSKDVDSRLDTDSNNSVREGGIIGDGDSRCAEFERVFPSDTEGAMRECSKSSRPGRARTSGLLAVANTESREDDERESGIVGEAEGRWQGLDSTTCSCGADVADSPSIRFQGFQEGGLDGQDDEERQEGREVEPEGSGLREADVANSDFVSEPQAGQAINPVRDQGDSWHNLGWSDWRPVRGGDWRGWGIEPVLRSGDDGVSSGVACLTTKERKSALHALGNAVVPQQVYPILLAIKQMDETL